jgi:hypothetical protein
MQSGESSVRSSEQPSQRWENLFGMAIALLTLLLPLWVIGYYSQADSQTFGQGRYQIPTLKK